MSTLMGRTNLDKRCRISLYMASSQGAQKTRFYCTHIVPLAHLLRIPVTHRNLREEIYEIPATAPVAAQSNTETLVRADANVILHFFLNLSLIPFFSLDSRMLLYALSLMTNKRCYNVHM